MRFHCLGIPHTVTHPDFSACAFTQKVLKFCAMMHRRGHHVIHYGHEDSKVECSEHVTVTTNETLKDSYGDHDWHANFFKHNTSDHAHVTFNVRASLEVSKRKQQGDYLLLFWSGGHQMVFDSNKDLIVVEPGIGCFAKPMAPFSVFESYAVMSHNYGKYEMSPRYFDAVIQNYFDVKDFEDCTHPVASGTKAGDTIEALEPGFVLMTCRKISEKGIGVAVDACRLSGDRLVIAGQGSVKDVLGGTLPDHVTELGYVNIPQRKALIAKAKAVMAPTFFLEPFGGVAVEAQMSGVPAVTSDWGAFPETVVHGVTGYRCRVVEHYVWALKNVSKLDRAVIRKWAIDNYSLEAVAVRFEEYFQMIATVHNSNGFYHERPERTQLDWLNVRSTSQSSPCERTTSLEALLQDTSTSDVQSLSSGQP